MNRKALISAMSVTLSAFVAIGCNGVKQSHSISDASLLAEQLVIEPAPSRAPEDEASVEQIMIETDETEAPIDMEISPMVAVADETVQQEIAAAAVTQQATTQPGELQFYFASNQTQVKQQDYEKLIAHAEYLIKHPDMKLKLSGHADQSGSREYNQQLAEKRAQSVAAVLIEYGVQPDQIATESLGEEYPTSGYEHAIYDRRVELEYSAITRLTESSF